MTTTTLARSRPRNLRRGLSATAALIAFLVGVPTLLIHLSRSLLDTPNPLAGITPPWRWTLPALRHTFGHALAPDSVITSIARLGLIASWCVFAIITLGVVVELRSLRLHGIHAPTIRGFGWSQTIARNLATGVMALSSVLPTHLAMAAPLPARVVATQVATAHAPATQEASTTAAAAPTNDAWSTYRVARGDSVYSIAAGLAGGDRTRTREIAQQILDRNLGHPMTDGRTFTTPSLIQVGWTLEIPQAGRPTPTTAPTTNEPSTTSDYVVQPGDSYWKIAAQHLRVEIGHTPTPHEVAVEVTVIKEANVDRFGQRQPVTMLHPGDELRIPGTTTPPLPPPEPSTDQQAPAEAAPEVSTPTTTQPIEEAPAVPVVTTTTITPVQHDPTPIDTTHTGEHNDTPINPWAKLALGTMFATGAVSLIRRFRRRRLAHRNVGERLPIASAHAANAEAVLNAEANLTRVEAVQSLLAALCCRISLQGTQPMVRAAQLNADGIELLWNEPQPDPVAPWVTGDGGWSWNAAWNETPALIRPFDPILPALVAVGQRADGSELLLDLEAAGSLSIDGPAGLVEAFAQQLVLSLATNPLAFGLDVLITDLVVPGSAHLDRVRTASPSDATRWATARTNGSETGLQRLNVTSSAEARLMGNPHDEWEPAVVVMLSTGVEANGLVGICRPGSGSVAVVAGHENTHERIVLHSAESAEWNGVLFTPFVITAETGDELEALLDHVDNGGDPFIDEFDIVDEIHEAPSVVRQIEFPLVTPVPSFAEGRYDVLVRVLGEITVEGCSEHLTKAETELLVLLASYRPDGPLNLDRATTLLAHHEWRTAQVRTVQSRVSHLRRKLGLGTDGALLLPESRIATGNPSSYLISSRVITDIDLVEYAYEQADEVSSCEAICLLRSALELVRGKPYTANEGYTWAYDEHATTRAIQVVVDATVQLVDLCGQAGDLAGLRWAVDRAGRAIDDPALMVPIRRAESKWMATSASGEP